MLSLCNSMDCSPLLWSWGFSRQEYWSGLPGSPLGDLPNPGTEPRSPVLQADSLPSAPPEKPKNMGVGSLSLLQGNFPIQQLNQGLPHCRRFFTSWATREALKVTYFSSHTTRKPLFIDPSIIGLFFFNYRSCLFLPYRVRRIISVPTFLPTSAHGSHIPVFYSTITFTLSFFRHWISVLYFQFLKSSPISLCIEHWNQTNNACNMMIV